MKKTLTIILALALVFALSVPAFAYASDVQTLTATGSTSSVTVSGTAANGILAVMVEILDSSSASVAMESFPASGGAFSGTISGLSLAANTTYTVRAANYDGGLWETTSFTVPLPPPASGTDITLTFVTNGGESMNVLTFSNGSVVVLAQYVPTREGYDFSGWYSDEALTKAVTSVTLTQNLTVYAGWSRRNPFTDIKVIDYFYDAVLWAVAEKITEGTSTTTFSPTDICTRAQMVTFLWRAMRSPEPTVTVCPFTDVSASDYYYKAVLWAVEKDVTAGTDATTFSPNDTVTRNQAVTFIWRAAGKPTESSENPFDDVPGDAYYTEAVLWAVNKSITDGTGAATFSPTDNCIRAQIVTFLYRYLGK